LKILLSNPSIQYSKHTFKSLHQAGHEVLFATAYWYRPNRFIEKLFSITSLDSYIKRYSDTSIPTQSVETRIWATFFHFLIKFIPFDVEQKSYWEDRIHDQWVAGLVKKWKPDLIIGYEKSSLKSFNAADAIGAIKWLDLAQVHPKTIASLREKLPFFKLITGTDQLFTTIQSLKEKEYEHANTITCLSQFAANTLKEAGIDSNKILINPLGFDESIFYENVQNEKNQNEPIHFIYTGIITKRKGVELLLETFAGIPNHLAKLTLIGPAGDATPTLNKFLEYGNIFYQPYLNQQELAKALRSADVFVFPSYLDSWAAVVLEAMASGLPVIVTNYTGAAQLVNVKNGIVIPAGDKEAILNAMLNFIQFPNLISVMGRSAAAIAKEHTWKKYTANLIKELNKLTINNNYV
jgi:glycosyltransferase involved in cell wall biosynthesis